MYPAEKISEAWNDGNVYPSATGAMTAFVVSNYEYALHSQPYVVSSRLAMNRSGDLLVGFSNPTDAPQTFEVRVGTQCIEQMTLAPGEKRAALWGLYPYIMFIAIRTEWFLVGSARVDAIYCYVNRFYREQMVRFLYADVSVPIYASFGEKTFMYRPDGSCGLQYDMYRTSHPPGEKIAPLTIEDSEHEMQVRILSRLNIIRQELMEQTWHPTRVCGWCGLFD
jgi:hypothetical protein